MPKLFNLPILKYNPYKLDGLFSCMVDEFLLYSS